MAEPKCKNLIIVGSAPCAIIDMAAVPRVCSYDFMAIGMDAIDKYHGRLEYVATFHPADIPEIYRRRVACGGNIDFSLISHERRDEVHIFVPDWWKPSGSSALLGVQAAIMMLGYTRIILCGCPLEGNNDEGCSYAGFRRGFEAHAAQIDGLVRSMSGWTKEFLGGPTDEWLLCGRGTDEA